MNVTMIRDLTHHVIDDEIAIAVSLSCDKRERLDHECLLVVGRRDAMISEHRHRRVARIAIENRELEWSLILTVPGSVVFQFA